jgi:glutamine synthetase
MLRVMPDRGSATRVENRLPDSAANPYLALTAMIIAGSLGIKQEIDPGVPTTGDATQASTPLPRTIGEAAQLLNEPSEFRDYLDPDLILAYRGLLWQAADQFEAQMTDWEIATYRDML